MVDFFYFGFSVFLFVIACLFFCDKKSYKKAHVWGVLVSYLFIVFLAYKFVQSTGGFSNQVNPETWAQFGSFLGSILLVVTIFFQVRAFRRQQVVAKFFEMVKYYRENISEMKFRNPFYYKEVNREFDEQYVQGRRVLKTIFEQYRVGLKVADRVDFREDIPEYEVWKAKVHEKYKMNTPKQSFSECIWMKNFLRSELAFLITYWGIPLDIDQELRNHLRRIINDHQLNELMKELPKYIAVYEFPEPRRKIYSANLRFFARRIENEIEPCYLDKFKGKIKFFGGHQYHLGHYFRHLFQTVKYIDKQPLWLFNKDEKYEYVKTLRAQMSNYEQALLFVNSLTSLGRKWEYEGNVPLISRYNLIKNLPENFIPGVNPQFYYPNVNFEWNIN